MGLDFIQLTTTYNASYADYASFNTSGNIKVLINNTNIWLDDLNR